DEEMVLACAPSHPLARHQAIEPAQLQGEKYIGFDKKLAIRRQLDRFFRKQRVAVQVALEFDNIENIKKAVEIGAGGALVPEPTRRDEGQGGGGGGPGRGREAGGWGRWPLPPAATTP